MSATYHQILENINKQSPAIITLAKQAFLWVFTARRPLTIQELGGAVAIETMTVCRGETKPIHGQTILNACGNFLMIDSRQLVRPDHHSVQEYLNSTCSLSAVECPTVHQQYQFFLPEANADLAHYCIQFMLFKYSWRMNQALIVHHYLHLFVLGFTSTCGTHGNSRSAPGHPLCLDIGGKRELTLDILYTLSYSNGQVFGQCRLFLGIRNPRDFGRCSTIRRINGNYPEDLRNIIRILRGSDAE